MSLYTGFPFGPWLHDTKLLLITYKEQFLSITTFAIQTLMMFIHFQAWNSHFPYFLMSFLCPIITCFPLKLIFFRVFLQDSWRSSYPCRPADGHVSSAHVGEGKPAWSFITCTYIIHDGMSDSWCVRLQALDVLLEKMRNAGFDFSRVKALSGSGQVTLNHLFIIIYAVKYTILLPEINHPS